MSSPTQTAAQSLAALPGGAAGLRRAAGLRQRGQAPIFMLHRVLPDPRACYDPEMAVSTSAFEQFAAWVRDSYEVVALADLQARLRTAGRDGHPLCALTFDDGWQDTYQHAFPVLARLQLPFTVFVPLAFLGGECWFWQDRLAGMLAGAPSPERAAAVAAVAAGFPWCPPLQAGEAGYASLRRLLARRASPEAEEFVQRLAAALGVPAAQPRRFMNWTEVGEMRAAGVDFGSHTLHHTLLRWAAPAAAAEELQRSRLQLQEQLGAPVRAFSYPWGGTSPFTRAQLTRAGYDCAVTTQAGLAESGSDPLCLPRLAISQAQLGLPLASGGEQPHFQPATVQLHLARARRQSTPQPPRADSAPLRKLRIGILVDNPEAWGYPPEGNLGGSELQLLRLIEALDSDYFQPELYFLRPPASGLPTGLPWPVFGSPDTRRGRWATLNRLRRLLRRHRPDVVQSMFVDSTLLGVPAAWLAGVPAILCARRNAGYWKRWYHRAALRVINRMATAWQVNSPLIVTMLQQDEGVPAAAIEIVPNWIDLAKFHPAGTAERQAARQALGLDAGDFVAVCVANYSPVKDLPVLVAAARMLQSTLPGLRVLLVGDGDERGRLQAAIAAGGLEAEVRLEGTSDQVAHYLQAADVGLLPSRSEGCSNSVLEYMAAGLPVVLSDIPANRALAAQGFFPAGDAVALAAALQRLAADAGLRAAQGAANRQRAESYGGQAFAARVQGHYLRAAASGARRERP